MKIKPVYDPYRNSLKDVLNNNINNKVNSINLGSIKQIMFTTQPKMLYNDPISFKLFNEVASNNSKNSKFFAKKSISPKLPINIILKELLNIWFEPFDKNNRLKKKIL